MNKTSDQIYDEVEARWIDSAKEKKTKSRRRKIEAALVVGTFIAFVIWAIVTKLNPIFVGFSSVVCSFVFSELQKRWSLEDRIEVLEKRK